MKNKGITLIALIVTIVVLLILAGITIGTLTGENGIIGNSKEAKEQTEIANEKEILEQATIDAMGEEKYGNITSENLEQAINKIIGEGKTEVNEAGDKIEVNFIDSQRYYEIDSNGNIGKYNTVAEDLYPGDITKDENGNALDGSEENPYEINCIEDLVVFSNMVNGTGIKLEDGQAINITTSTSFANKYIILKRDLNFKSKNSYINSKRTDFGDVNGNDTDGNALITEMTSGTGFTPIGNTNSNSNIGDFDGNNNKLEGLYEQKENNAGLFGRVIGTIKNLEVSGSVISEGATAAGIVIYLYSGEINNCKNYCKVDGNIAGGLIGEAGNVKIEGCCNNGKITSTTGKAGGKAGGIVGDEYASNVTIINSCNYGIIEAENYAGGIFGHTTAGKINIYNCYNMGEITANCSNNGGFNWGTGGILGFKYHTTVTKIINCINMGKINNDSHRGAIIGFNWMPTTEPEVINSFYQSDNGIKGESNNNNSQAIEFDTNKEEVVKELNNYILEKPDGIETEGWKQWKIKENQYIVFEKI